MALSTPVVIDIHDKNSGFNTTQTTGSYDLSSYGSGLVVVAHSAQGPTGATSWTMTDGFTGSGSWTDHGNISLTSGNTHWINVQSMVLGASPGTATFTMTTDQSFFRGCLGIVVIASGFHATTPVLNFQSGSGTGSTVSLTMDAFTSGAVGLGFHGQRDGTVMTVETGSGYTEQSESYTSVNTIGMMIQWDDSSPGTSLGTEGLDGTTEVLIGVEIQEAAAGGGGSAPIFVHHMNQLRA